MPSIDSICYASRLRNVNAAVKFWFSILTLALCVAGRSVCISLLVLLVNSLLITARSGLAWKRYGKLLAAPLTFLLLATAAIVISISRRPLSAFAISAGSWYVTAGWDSLAYGGRLMLTALACVSCLYFLSVTTPVTDIPGVLESLRCPRLFLELMLLIYRYIFLLLSLASVLTTAQQSRLGNRDFRTSLRSFGALGQALFVQSIVRSRLSWQAMESRCYQGQVNVLHPKQPVKKSQVLLTALFELLLLALVIIRRCQLWILF